MTFLTPTRIGGSNFGSAENPSYSIGFVIPVPPKTTVNVEQLINGTWTLTQTTTNHSAQSVQNKAISIPFDDGGGSPRFVIP